MRGSFPTILYMATLGSLIFASFIVVSFRSKTPRAQAIAEELRLINWIALAISFVFTSVVAIGELLRQPIFHPTPLRFYVGVIGLPAFWLAWFSFSIAHQVRQLPARRLGSSIATSAIAFLIYAVVAAFTVTPG